MKIPFHVLLLAVGLMVMGNGLQGNVLPLRGAEEGFDSLGIGLLGTFYYIGMLVGCLVMPRLCLVLGYMRLYALMASLAACSALIHVLFVQLDVWLACRFLTGLSLAGLMMVAESWMNSFAQNTNRGTITGYYKFTNLVAVTVGQMLVMVISPYAFPAFVVVALLFSFSLMPIVFLEASEPERPKEVQFNPKLLYQTSPSAFVLVPLTSLSTGAMFSLGIVYARGIGYSVEEAALFMVLVFLGGALSQIPIGRYSDKVDRRTVMAGCQVVSAILALILALGLGVSHLEFMLLGMLLGAAIIPIQALSAAHAYDRSKRGDFFQISGTLLVLLSIGSAIGPMLAGFLMDVLGHFALFGMMAVVHVLAYVFILRRLVLRQGVRVKKAFAVMSPLNIAGIKTLEGLRFMPKLRKVVSDPPPVTPDELGK